MDLSIGERIKNRRKEMNITQTQIREETGISSGNMSGIESGKSLPSASALIELSRVLDCSIDWILKGDSTNKESRIISNKRECKLIDGFRSLSEENRKELMEILEIKLRHSSGSSGGSSKLSLSESTSQANIS